MKSRGRVTLQTIAHEVGLSKYAVSRSLSGKSGVSEETRERIRQTALRLGYSKPPTRPHPATSRWRFMTLIRAIASYTCRSRTACRRKRTG